MSGPAVAIVLAAALVTAIISGIFGMAGGIVLMGVLTFVLPVQAAFVTHGFIQIVANGWRAILHREHIRWAPVAGYLAGALGAALIVLVIAITPSKMFVYLMLFAVSATVWLPKNRFSLDAARPAHAIASGLVVTGVNLTAGVAGPLLDIFFVRTDMTRHQIVATKAATQVLSHAAKIGVYGAPLLASGGAGMPPWWLFAAAAPLTILGTLVGARVLDQMSDRGFIAWSKWIISAVGFVYLIRALQLLIQGGA